MEFVKNEALINAVIFYVQSAFYKGPRSTFSEGPGLGLLFKI